MEIYFPLDNGQIVKPVFYEYALPAPGIKIVQELSEDVKESIRWADLAVQSLTKRRYGFAIEITPEAYSIRGKSGGLAIALALLSKLNRNNPRPGVQPKIVVATGEIDPQGNIGEVDSLPAKLEGAITQFPDGGIFLYPKKNKRDIDNGLRERANAQGFKLVVVSNLKDALKETAIYLDFTIPIRRLTALILIVIFVLGLTYYYYKIANPLAHEWLEHGYYQRAKIHLLISTNVFPWRKDLAYLLDLLNTRFELQIYLHYLDSTGRRSKSCALNSDSQQINSPEGIYKLSIQSSHPVYVYVYLEKVDYMSGPKGNLGLGCRSIFSEFFKTEFPGQEKIVTAGYQIKQTTPIHLIASYWPCLDLTEDGSNISNSSLQRRDKHGYGAFYSSYFIFID